MFYLIVNNIFNLTKISLSILSTFAEAFDNYIASIYAV